MAGLLLPKNLSLLSAGRQAQHGEWPDQRFICSYGLTQYSSISSTASYYATGNSLIALYGWTANPLVEYYVIDYLGNYNPGSAGQHLRSFNSDGGTYNIYQTTRTNAPSILGTSTFKQCLSVRTSNRLGGTITLPIHIAAWRSKGLVGVVHSRCI